jgi:hypothetical protein
LQFTSRQRRFNNQFSVQWFRPTPSADQAAGTVAAAACDGPSVPERVNDIETPFVISLAGERV